MKRLAPIFISALLLLIVGCSSKNEAEYNKSDIYWYQKMIYYISVDDLDKADEYYSSLQSEHFASPLLKEATLLMAQAHMDSDEYLMAKYYLDEYKKRYGDEKSLPFVEYLKIKASFLAFKSINRDQKLLADTIKDALAYKQKYPQAKYIPLIDTMLTKLYLAQYVLDREIASLYKRRGKEKAAKIYEERYKNFWLKKDEIDIPKSWYDYLINW